jgi:hypothetical protein
MKIGTILDKLRREFQISRLKAIVSSIEVCKPTNIMARFLINDCYYQAFSKKQASESLLIDF